MELSPICQVMEYSIYFLLLSRKVGSLTKLMSKATLFFCSHFFFGFGHPFLWVVYCKCLYCFKC
ncbi:hypothetical protein JHK85_003121 [Glycine max]|uniref:Uncharacterized protein n=1 Tax=Glycine max TaxID=3847 RepID=K7K602_SOYBN|nr:hypothetical protein JHK87_002790 [Glycine soja]KAG5061938.1 hypothetical protein JHK85_003121 [Glycine max]KAG5078903.1 hypothetical protein JHK86_002968 [Glycine max]